MEREIIVPHVGDGVDEVEISEWYVSPGDTVKKGTQLAELIAEKAVIELESNYDGTVTQILHPAGAVVNVGETVLLLKTS